MKNFKELKIWQKGYQIAVNCFKLTSDFPPSEKFGISSQINRAGVSIPSNIAEGSSRTSAKEYKYFVEIALGSCFEVETQLLIANELGFGSVELRKELFSLLTEEEKMLVAFSRALSSK